MHGHGHGTVVFIVIIRIVPVIVGVILIATQGGEKSITQGGLAGRAVGSGHGLRNKPEQSNKQKKKRREKKNEKVNDKK